ncbi:MAG: hypothetical protein KQH67_12565 [Bacteroidetes bacterium]|nr:hypothetical protein [Bacteroidota bacterium]
MKLNYGRVFFLVLILFILASCSRSGVYSLIVTSDVQPEQNPLNELPGYYNKKNLRVPASVVVMSDENKNKWMDTLNHYNVHTIDTTVKISVINEFGSVIIGASACRNQALAIVVHDASQIVKHGKYLHLKLRYVCMDDTIDMVWAATHNYKIDECFHGFHAIEYQFYYQNILKNEEKQSLKNVFVVCAED